MNPNFNYSSLFNPYYHDPRTSYSNYIQPYEPNLFEEAEAPIQPQDYTFLPKTTSFFDHHIGSPLDVTRQSTDITEMNEATPLFNQKVISPSAMTYQKLNLQDYNSKFCNINVKSAELPPAKNKFVAVLGNGTGITYNGYNICIDAKGFVSQPSSASALGRPLNVDMIKKEEHVEDSAQENFEKHANDDDDHMGGQTMLNTQLRSLLESRIWSSEKDQMLLKLGAQYKCDWKKIAKRFNNKKVTPHFLKIRYKELTCAPLQRRVKFNHKEDLMIAKYFEKYGSNWAQMATHFNNRTAIMLKNRYYSFIRKRELLDGLLQKVTDVEKEGVKVDDMKDQESETCYDMFVTHRESNGEESEQFSTSHGALEAERSSSQGHESPEEHPIFGYEREPVAVNPVVASFVRENEESKVMKNTMENERNNNVVEEDDKEVETLKARIKSLQTLYLKTKNELDLYKQKP